jgi:hypothetical protein
MNQGDLFMRAAKTYQSSEEPERLQATAGSYWRAMLTVAVAVSVAATAGGAYMLVMTFLNLTVNRSEDGPVQTLDRAELARAVAGISSREAHFNDLKVGTSTIADPSM